MKKPLSARKVCLTGVTSSEERYANDMIKSLGGKLSNDLTKDAFCLLVKRVGSPKYQAAQNLNIPCVQLQWLSDCYTSQSFISYDNYKVKSFTGLSFSITGFEPEERFKMQQLITENGGVNCTIMTKDNCTHLIALNTSGEKYKAAKQWKVVNIITKHWLDECIKQNKWVSEIPYLVQKSTKPMINNHLNKTSSENSSDLAKKKLTT